MMTDSVKEHLDVQIRSAVRSRPRMILAAGTTAQFGHVAEERMTRSVLLRPPRRWTAESKEALLRGIADQVVSLEDACNAHTLSPEEILSWCRGLSSAGRAGLRSYFLPRYREMRA